VSIPSPPAIWLPHFRTIGVPDIRDAERLQGFPANWTKSTTLYPLLQRGRWALIGNAVSVPVARWIARRLLKPGRYHASSSQKLSNGDPWGVSGWGWKGLRYRTDISEWPVRSTFHPLDKFLIYPVKALSMRATAGFLRRAKHSSLRFPAKFLDDIEYYLDSVQGADSTPEKHIVEN
jgi:DNA (cytosine-5)-methyltransferase 1